MKRMGIWIAMAALAGGLAASADGADKATAQSLPRDSVLLLAPGDISWKPTTRPGVTRAALWGDRTVAPYGEFDRYEGGFHLPWHFHTNDLRGLIISGIWVLELRGQTAKELPTGSYFSVPGKTPHMDTCKAGSVCVLYLTGDQPLDLIPVTPD